MKLSFHGADRGVTGSCHLLESAGKRVLVDCGLYQGGRQAVEENAGDFGFEARDADFVLLTHAHLDHCGRLPLLNKRGFRGEIVATAATRDLARLVLLDAAHLQEEEARAHARRAERRGDAEPPAPLYGLIDALNVFDRFGRTASYAKRIELAPGLAATFFDAGHILGSASILVEAEGKRLLFSGDIGNRDRAILRDPVVPGGGVDVAVMESTYGDRDHSALGPTLEEFYAALNESFQRGGNVIIPTFALERAQELLFYMREGIEQNKLPAALQVFLDSPMAISATEIFRAHPECYDGETAALFARKIDPFAVPRLRFCREAAESIMLNTISGGAVIMAGAGMCNGGRVRHHLRHNLARAGASVIFVGFAAKGTLARQIIDGARKVSLFGEEVVVRARIYTINGFSAHAGQTELVSWQAAAAPARTFLTHGEEDAMAALAARLHGPVDRPELGQSFTL